MPRLTQAQRRRIADAYLAWDPSKMTLQQLADEHGVSRQTVYSVIQSFGIQPKMMPRAEDADVLDLRSLPAPIVDRMADRAVQALIEDMKSCYAKLEAARLIINDHVESPACRNCRHIEPLKQLLSE